MEFEPMLTPREKSPLPKMSPEEDRTRDTGQRAQALPTELFRPQVKEVIHKKYEADFLSLLLLHTGSW